MENTNNTDYFMKVLLPEDGRCMCGDFIKGSPKTWRFQLTEEEAAFLPEKDINQT